MTTRAIRFLNADLDLASPDDLTTLAGAFVADGVVVLSVDRAENGTCFTTITATDDATEPESDLAALLGIVESFSVPLRAMWNGCSRREFNLGYECGDRPWAFDQSLSHSLLCRITAAGASMRLTLYPHGVPDDDSALARPPQL